MKDKILTLIIGILIGAIIATTGFLVYHKILAKNQNQLSEMNENSQMREIPEQMNGNNGEEPPEKPDGEDNEEPPEEPETSNKI